VSARGPLVHCKGRDRNLKELPIRNLVVLVNIVDVKSESQLLLLAALGGKDRESLGK